MRQFLKVKSLQPPGGFRAKCVHCGFWLSATAWNDFVPMVAQHNAANGHPEWDFEDEMCKLMPPGSCLYEDGSSPKGISALMTIGDLWAGMKAIGRLLAGYASGEEVTIGQAEAERRADLCSRCRFNVSAGGCTGCIAGNEAKAVVDWIVKERHTTSDSHLNSCAICTCSTRAIVWLRPDIIKLGFTDREREVTQELASHCWKLGL